MLKKAPPTSIRPLLSVSAAIIGFALAGSNLFAQTPDQDEVKSHLPAGTVASDPGEGETLATNEQIAEATRQAIAHLQSNPSTHPFTPGSLTGGGVALRPGAVGLIVDRAIQQSPSTSYADIVRAAFDRSNIGVARDKPAVAGAIVAGAICGAKEANGSLSVLKGAVKTIVLQAILSTRQGGTTNATISVGNTAEGDFRVNLDPSPSMDKLDLKDGFNDDKGLSTASAGIVTGAVSQLTGERNNGKDSAIEANKYVKVIVKTAVKNASKEFLEIAQAAATAAASVFNLTSNVSSGYKATTIQAAVIAGLVAAKKTITAGKTAKIKLAIKFGIAQANAGQPGAGARGVANYAFNNCNGNAVTDVSGF